MAQDLCRRACTALARRHAPVLRALDARGIPEPRALTTRHLVWIDEVLGDTSGLEEGVAWLRANQPQLPERLCLVHGDLWPANVLMHGPEICGLVDWTMGAVGDPALDVGFAKVGLALMPEPFPPPRPIGDAVNRCGQRMARHIHQRCAPLVGGDDRVSYYEALRCMLQIAVVHADRQAARPNGWEHGLPALMRHLNTITGLVLPTAQPPQ